MQVPIQNLLKSNSRKEIFLYGYIYSFIVILSVALLIDLLLSNFDDALTEGIAIVIVLFLNYYLHKSGKIRVVSILLMWCATLATFSLVFINDFAHNSYFFLFFVPFGYYLVLDKKDILPQVSVYFLLFTLFFIYGYLYSQNRYLFDDKAALGGLFIATLFVIAIGIFIYYAIEQSFEKLEALNQQKEILLKEVHHRVKNNLNMISSILALQSDPEDKKLQSLIDKNRMRIESISIVHEMLYSFDDLEKVSFNEYATRLSNHVLISSSLQNIKINIDSSDVALKLESMVFLGLMIQEMLTNSLKYAFKDDGEIKISLQKEKCNFKFSYADSGQGYNFNDEDKNKTLGINLIKLSTKQLGAKLDIINDNGLKYILEFTCE